MLPAAELPAVQEQLPAPVAVAVAEPVPEPVSERLQVPELSAGEQSRLPAVLRPERTAKWCSL